MSGQRFDKFLGRYMNGAPKTFIHKMLRKKNITINGKKSTGAEILQEGDVVKLFLAEETIREFIKDKVINRTLVDMPTIVYEDKNILVVDKPKNMLAHPDTKTKDSLIDRILLYLHNKGEYDLNAPFTPALANRIDKNTTGLVLCGKNLKALQALNEMIKNKTLKKYYQTLVVGEVEQSEQLVGYHQKDEENNQVEIFATAQGEKDVRQVVTTYTPIEKYKDYTLLEIELVTGKSHQIRAHLQSISHPIVGDPKYGDATTNIAMRSAFNLRNQLLHSHKLAFTEKNGTLGYLCDKEITVDSPLIKQVTDTLERR